MKKIALCAILSLLSGAVFAGDVAQGQAKSAVCGACHAADGNSTIAENPKLAGQGAKYLIKQLHDFKSGARENAIMQGQVMALTDEDIENISAFYAAQKVQHTAAAEDSVALGQALYRGGDVDRGIPACGACHGANGAGLAAAGYPAVGGQTATYTVAQLKAFQNHSRKNDANAVMRNIAARMTDEQINAIANYLVGLH